MAVLSREQVAQAAYQAGFRGDALVGIVAIAGRESSYRSDAHRTDRPKEQLSGDRGLLQINYVHDDILRQAGIISSPSDLFDPVTNLRAAKYLFDHMGGFDPWTAGPGGWTAGGDPFYGTNREAARAAVDNAASQGLLGQDYVGSGGMSMTERLGPVQLPDDAQVYNISGTYEIFAVFDVGNGIRLAYTIDTSPGAVDWKSKPLQTATRDQWDQMGVVPAGDAAELMALPSTFGSFKEFWDSLLMEVLGSKNPARNDPSVLKVMAEFAARPDMELAELQNRLQGTEWFQKHTSKELEWNSLSEAEQAKRLEDTKADVVDTWFQYVGEQISPDDPRVAQYVAQLASGKMGWGAFTNIVKTQAAEVSESPWGRTVRDEQEAQRQRGIDIENSAQKIRRTLERWGIQWTDGEIMSWAKRMTENEASDDDLMNAIQSAASVLYPWKDPQQETLAAAQPWLATYERVMEKRGTLFTPQVQKALSQGQAAMDFEQDLKRSDEWLTTGNAKNELTSLVAAMGSKMGFH